MSGRPDRPPSPTTAPLGEVSIVNTRLKKQNINLVKVELGELGEEEAEVEDRVTEARRGPLLETR